VLCVVCVVIDALLLMGNSMMNVDDVGSMIIVGTVGTVGTVRYCRCYGYCRYL
jgi:hypothetical protein